MKSFKEPPTYLPVVFHLNAQPCPEMWPSTGGVRGFLRYYLDIICYVIVVNKYCKSSLNQFALENILFWLLILYNACLSSAGPAQQSLKRRLGSDPTKEKMNTSVDLALKNIHGVSKSSGHVSMLLSFK
jgi:hypothetical protein